MGVKTMNNYDAGIHRPKKQLPTKSELRAELEKVCEIINSETLGTGPDHVLASICGPNGKGGLHIKIEKNNGICHTGKNHPFRPDPTPPPDNTVVFVGQNGRMRISTGAFNDNGELLCYNENPIYDPVAWPSWCCVLDRTNHSPGWKREWEPDYEKENEE